LIICLISSLIEDFGEGSVEDSRFDYAIKRKGWSHTENSLIGSTDECLPYDYYYICQYIQIDISSSELVDVRMIIEKYWL